MAWPLDARFKTPENANVLSFIARFNPSAHDEASSALTDSAHGLSDVAWYCPDAHAYAYVVLHARSRRIFGIAFGMSAVAFALPPDQITAAVQGSGKEYADIGPNWVVFGIGADLRRWCKLAHDHAVAKRPH